MSITGTRSMYSSHTQLFLNVVEKCMHVFIYGMITIIIKILFYLVNLCVQNWKIVHQKKRRKKKHFASQNKRIKTLCYVELACLILATMHCDQRVRVVSSQKEMSCFFSPIFNVPRDFITMNWSSQHNDTIYLLFYFNDMCVYVFSSRCCAN